VVQKGIHHVGAPIIYIPEDSVFTDIAVADHFGITPYLTGKYKNRVKAIRLRGVLSQGIVLPFTAFSGYVWDTCDPMEAHRQLFYVPEGRDYREFLKIEKYEEPIPIEMMGHVRAWPSFLNHYDVENIKRPESLLALVEAEEVVATEKLHGTNMTIAIGPGLDEGEEVYVCSRRLAIRESELNVYWRAARKFDLINKVKQLHARVIENELNFRCLTTLAARLDDVTVSIHGEVVGVQDLKYGHVNGDIGFYAFDIRINGEYVDADVFDALCSQLDIPRVPEVYRGPYSYDTCAKLATGKTTIGADHILEGVVVKPIRERYDNLAGRVQFKFISEDYLLRKGGTELH
jgi:RNA ligase (TIGR02306 family)